MRARQAIPWTLTLALAVAVGACGDDGEEPVPEAADSPSVTVDEVRGGADTAGAPDAGSDEEPAEEASARRTQTLYAVQVGSFVRSENASALRQRLEEEGFPAWTPTADIDGRSFQQVRVGATETVAEARRLADRVTERVEGEAWIAPVPPDVDLPAPVVDETRTLLGENG